MTAEKMIDLLMGLISPENAEEENEALGKAAKILQLIADNNHLRIHRMRRRWRYVGDGRQSGDLESNELNYCPRCGAKMDGGKS